MTVTVGNAMEIFQPVVDEIEAQTEAIEAIAACQGQALENIANNVLCGGTDPASLQSTEPVCCTSEEIPEADLPDGVKATTRVTCSDGSVTDTVTYDNDQTCTVVVKKASPQNTVIGLDENGNECLVGAANTCPARIVGQPYDEHFIPLLSDFSNPIFCIPGAKYAFAWTGVDAKNIKEFLEQNPEVLDQLNDINLPAGGGDSYRAELGGDPYACGQPDPDTGTNANALAPAGFDGANNAYYCFAGVAVAHTVNDVTMIDATTVAKDANGDDILCDGLLHPLQMSQANRLDGCYAAFGTLCPAWDGEPTAPTPDPDAGAGDPTSFIDSIQNFFSCDPVVSIEGKTAQESHYLLWQDWWQCEQRSKCIQQYIYGAQIPIALYAMIESLQTYNKLLDKNFSMICDTQEHLSSIAECERALIGTAEEPGLLKECEANLLAGHNDRIGLINNRGQHACDLADDEFDCYDQLWKGIQHDHADDLGDYLSSMISNGELTSDATLSWACKIDDAICKNMLPELMSQFKPLMDSANCSYENLNEWRADLVQHSHDLQSHFNTAFQPGEAKMMPVLMDATTCMVQRICEMRNYLYDCAKCEQTTADLYRAGEAKQAQKAMAISAQLIPKLAESAAWLDTNIPYVLDIFKTCYADPQKTLNPRLYEQAIDLAPEVKKAFEFFNDKSIDAAKIFETCYKDRECELAGSVIDFACSLVKDVETEMASLKQWITTDRQMYDNNFRSQEITGLQEVATQGSRASTEMHDIKHWWDERTKEYYGIYHDLWLPADQDNLKRHLQVWERGDPLQQLERNAEDMNKLGKDLLDASHKGILKANTYLDEVFKEADSFDYCVESPAVHHVRKQVDRAIKQLERCSPKYAVGHVLAAKMKLKTEGARIEGAAYDAATRWKWWANEQLEQRNFDNKASMLAIVDGLTLRAIDANKTESGNYDLLLTHMREALVRGQAYLATMQEAGNLTYNMNNTELDAMLRSIQLMHFWPEMALRERGEFLSQSNSMIDDAHQLLQLGHYWPSQSSQDKTSGVSVINQSFDVALRLSQMGQFYMTQADQMNTERATIANQAGVLGNQYANTGHNLHRLAADKASSALQQSIQSGQLGLGASEIGSKHMNLALEMENRMTLNALEHMKAGIAAYGIGLDFLQEVRQSYELSGSYGNNSANTLINLFKHGQNAGLFALTANEYCAETNYKMLCKAKDFMQENHKFNMSALHGDNTVASTNNLLTQQGDNVGGAFGLLGNSLQGITQNSSLPPFSTGAAGGTPGGFGFNGGSF